MPFRTVLVTGASGFVGRTMVPALAAALPGEAALYLAARAGEAVRDTIGTPVLFDLENPAIVAATIDQLRPDLVIHLAGQASVGQSTGTAAATWSTNLCGSLALAEAVARITPSATILFVSSVETYGLTFNEEIVTEASPLRPQSAYARSKAAVEAMLADVLPASARLIVARPSNHSGPGQDDRFVIPAFATQIARVEAGAANAVRVGNLEAERDFLDVRDVVAAYLTLLAHAATLPSRATFNIASARPVRIRTILDKLLAMSPIDITLEQDEARMRPSEVARAAIDASTIRRATGWAPVHSLEETLTAVLKDARARCGSAAIS